MLNLDTIITYYVLFLRVITHFVQRYNTITSHLQYRGCLQTWPWWLALLAIMVTVKARLWGPKAENMQKQGQSLPSETFYYHHCPFAFQRHDKVCLHTWGLELLGAQTLLDQYSLSRTLSCKCHPILLQLNGCCILLHIILDLSPCSTFCEVYTAHFIVRHHGKSCSFIHRLYCFVLYILRAKPYLQKH